MKNNCKGKKSKVDDGKKTKCDGEVKRKKKIWGKGGRKKRTKRDNKKVI